MGDFHWRQSASNNMKNCWRLSARPYCESLTKPTFLPRIVQSITVIAKTVNNEPSEEFELTAHMKAMESLPSMGDEELVSRAFI